MRKLTRSDLVIALGGGVIGDLTGFAASRLPQRGKVCTDPHFSLLAQWTRPWAVRLRWTFPRGRTWSGAFFQPKLVLIDPEVLDTLPEHFIKDGMGEVIKYGCIKDAGLFNLLCSHTSFDDLKSELTGVIARCVDIKRIVVEADQFDTGERMLLNFGHTLAHHDRAALSLRAESHGEAVGIGMYQITKIAEEKGLTAPGCAEKIRNALKIYGLPDSCGLHADDLTGAIALDKKNLKRTPECSSVKRYRRQLCISDRSFILRQNGNDVKTPFPFIFSVSDLIPSVHASRGTLFPPLPELPDRHAPPRSGSH